MSDDAETSPLARLVARGRAFMRSPMFFYTLGGVAAKLNSFLLIPLYVKRLTNVEYGTFALAQTIIGILPTLMTIGLGASLGRVYVDAKTPAEGAAKVTRLLHVSVYVAMVATLVLGVAFEALRARTGLSRYHALLVLVTCWGAIAAGFPDAYLRYAQRPRGVIALQLTQMIAGVVAGVVLVGWLHRGVTGALEAVAIATATQGVAGLVVVVRVLPPAWRDGPVFRPAAAVGLPILGHAASTWALAQGDRWVLKVLALDAALGPYVLATQLCTPATMLVAAYNDADMPVLGEEVRVGGLERLRRAMPRRRARYALVSLVAGVGTLAAVAVFRGFLPPGYRDAFWIAPVIVLGMLFDSQYLPATNGLYFSGRTTAIAIASMAGGALALAAALALGPALGVTGVLIARTGGAAAKAGFVSFALWRSYRATTSVEAPA